MSATPASDGHGDLTVTVHLLVCGTCGGVTESKYALYEEGSTFYCSTPCFMASFEEMTSD